MNSTKRTALIPIRTQNSADPVQSGPRLKRRPPSISVISVLLKSHTGNLFVRRVRRSQNLNQIPANMLIAATFDLLPQESEATRRLGSAQGERPSVQACRLPTMGSTNSIGGCPHVCFAINNRSRDNGSSCFPPRAYRPSGLQGPKKRDEP